MQPTLSTARLVLRPYALEDAPAVQRLAGERSVAEPTLAIPHPYPDGAASDWISGHAALFASRKGVSFAITSGTSDELIGTASLVGISSVHARAEIGYWVGHPFWGNGYCTEAVIALMAFGEDYFQVSRFAARCLASNVGSSRVLEKVGLRLEGRQVRHVHHGDGFEDMLLYGCCAPNRRAT